MKYPTNNKCHNVSKPINSSLNNRYLTAGDSLNFDDTGILPANTIGHFYYGASLSKRAGFGVGVHTNASAEGFFNLEFMPATTPFPVPATMLLLGTGLAGLAGLKRKLKK